MNKEYNDLLFCKYDNELITRYLSPIEIDYFINLIKNDSSINDDTRTTLISKLNYLKDCYTIDPDLTMSCIMNNFNLEAGGIRFDYQSSDETIEVIDLETGDYITDSRLSKDLNQIIDVDNCGEIGEKIEEHVRFCSLCGRPMDRGYTNEYMYICSDSEFHLYMNNLCGAYNWRISTEDELKIYGANYMCREDQNKDWEPLNWYYTEWYDKYYKGE